MSFNYDNWLFGEADKYYSSLAYDYEERYDEDTFMVAFIYDDKELVRDECSREDIEEVYNDTKAEANSGDGIAIYRIIEEYTEDGEVIDSHTEDEPAYTETF